MGEFTQAERYLLDQIRRGESQGWSQLVERYQGRLLAFAQSKLRQPADAEDLVQETFIGFLKSLANFHEEASIETYLFTILRRRIIDSLRGRKLNACLIQDILPGHSRDSSPEPLGQIPSPDLTASWYVRRDEQADLERKALALALRELVGRFKESLNFRDLQIAEMLFYCQVPNKEVARLAELGEQHVALIKHRCLKHVRDTVASELRGHPPTDDSAEGAESMLTAIWEDQRLSCLKRSTIGAYLLGTLDQAWHDYVEFHLNRLGCRFCQANLEDLRRQTVSEPSPALRDRIMQSTVGFLRSI